MRKYSLRKCLIFAGLLAATITAAQSNQPQQPKSGSAADASSNNQATASSAVGNQQKTSANQNNSDDKTDADWWMVRLTAILAGIGGLQLIVFGRQAQMLDRTIQKMDEIAGGQTKDMRDSIAEAAKAAVAMDKVAGSLKINADKIIETVEINRQIAERQQLYAEMQLRAYVSVEVGAYFRQDKRLRFEFRPVLNNNGQTPANDVRVLSRCALSESIIPRDFDYSVSPPIGGIISSSTIFPRQNRFHTAVFGRRLTIQEMRQILRGTTCFHLWGQVNYQDVFNVSRHTNFSYLIFVPTNKRGLPIWHNTEDHNDAN